MLISLFLYFSAQSGFNMQAAFNLTDINMDGEISSTELDGLYRSFDDNGMCLTLNRILHKLNC